MNTAGKKKIIPIYMQTSGKKKKKVECTEVFKIRSRIKVTIKSLQHQSLKQNTLNLPKT